jgi:protein-S-isoprenylcysteine O-methyltransferase Ste14
MKRVFLATLILLIFTMPATGQEASGATKNAQYDRGRVKIWIGVSLVGVGALMVPVTATKSDTPQKGVTVGAGVGAIVTGSYLIWWGARDQRRSAQPHTMFGAFIGNKSGLQVRRTW